MNDWLGLRRTVYNFDEIIFCIVMVNVVMFLGKTYNGTSSGYSFDRNLMSMKLFSSDYNDRSFFMSLLMWRSRWFGSGLGLINLNEIMNGPLMDDLVDELCRKTAQMAAYNFNEIKNCSFWWVRCWHLCRKTAQMTVYNFNEINWTGLL